MVKQGLPRHPLQGERQGKTGFQLDHDRRFVAAPSQYVKMADLGFDLITLRLKKGFDDGIPIA